jgi:hypothetical protein
MITYTVIENPDRPSFIQADLGDGFFLLIPTDPANSDYQAYLATLPSNSSIPQAGE